MWAAAAITTSVASDMELDTGKLLKKGATCYLVPGAPLYTVVRNVDRGVHAGKTVMFYGSWAYKASKVWVAPIEYVNSLGAKALTQMGVTQAVKTACGVIESDALWWERPEYTDFD